VGAPDNPYVFGDKLLPETSSVAINNRNWLKLPYLPGEPIKITTFFRRAGGLFIHYIDGEFMRAQLASIIIEKTPLDDELNPERRYKNNNMFDDFDKADQYLNFTMPEDDIELIIKESSLGRKLIIKPEPYQYNNESRKLTGIIYNNEQFKFNEKDAEIVAIPNKK